MTDVSISPPEQTFLQFGMYHVDLYSYLIPAICKILLDQMCAITIQVYSLKNINITPFSNFDTPYSTPNSYRFLFLNFYFSYYFWMCTADLATA